MPLNIENNSCGYSKSRVVSRLLGITSPRSLGGCAHVEHSCNLPVAAADIRSLLAR